MILAGRLTVIATNPVGPIEGSGSSAADRQLPSGALDVPNLVHWGAPIHREHVLDIAPMRRSPF